jgi:hypothetical protein
MSQIQERSARKTLVATALALALVVGISPRPALADQIIMSCGASYGNPSVEFYLPYDGSILRFAFQVAGGQWQFTHWYYSSPDRWSARWTGSGWAYDNLLSHAQGPGPQRVIGYFQYLSDYSPNTWRYIGECSTSGMHTGGITYR